MQVLVVVGRPPIIRRRSAAAASMTTMMARRRCARPMTSLRAPVTGQSGFRAMISGWTSLSARILTSAKRHYADELGRCVAIAAASPLKPSSIFACGWVFAESTALVTARRCALMMLKAAAYLLFIGFSQLYMYRAICLIYRFSSSPRPPSILAGQPPASFFPEFYYYQRRSYFKIYGLRRRPTLLPANIASQQAPRLDILAAIFRRRLLISYIEQPSATPRKSISRNFKMLPLHARLLADFEFPQHAIEAHERRRAISEEYRAATTPAVTTISAFYFPPFALPHRPP